MDALPRQILLLPGLGADHRLTQMLLPLDIPSANDERHLDYATPDYIPWLPKESLEAYSARYYQFLVDTGVIAPERLCYIVGISLGGAVAQEMTRSKSASPNLRGIALVGSFTSVRELAYYVRFIARWIAPYLPEWVYRAMRPLVPVVLAGVSRVPRSSLRLLSSMYESMPRQFFARASWALARWRRNPSVAHSQFRVPILRIHGVDDHIIPSQSLEGVAFMIEGAKHLVSVSHIDVVREALTREIALLTNASR